MRTCAAAPVVTDGGSLDRAMMQTLLALSSSEPARAAASVWLAAFDAARGRGATPAEADAQAAEAWRRGHA